MNFHIRAQRVKRADLRGTMFAYNCRMLNLRQQHVKIVDSSNRSL